MFPKLAKSSQNPTKNFERPPQVFYQAELQESSLLNTRPRCSKLIVARRPGVSGWAWRLRRRSHKRTSGHIWSHACFRLAVKSSLHVCCAVCAAKCPSGCNPDPSVPVGVEPIVPLAKCRFTGLHVTFKERRVGRSVSVFYCSRK